MTAQKHGRAVRLILDIGVFAFGSLLIKIIQFLLLPFYTSFLSRAEYGTAELVFNFSQLMVPIATLSVASGVFRYAADNVDRKKLLSSGLCVVLIGEIIVSIGTVVFNSYKPMEYIGFFSILLLGEALKLMLGSITRGFGNSKRFAMGGPIDVFTLSISNIILIGVLKLGVTGYLYSLVISNYTTSLYYLLASRLYRYIRLSAVDRAMIGGLIVFSVPMMFNSIAWWFVNMSGRYIISWRGGAELAGAYIAVSKLPAIINVAAQIFQQAWQFSTAKEVESETRDKFFSDVFRYFAFFVLACSTVVVALCPWIADMMLKKEFRSIGGLLPILFSVGLLNCFSSFFGTFYNAFKRNTMIMVSTLSGAVVSVGLAYWFNNLWGPMGVAIGTSLGFVLIVAMRVVDTQLRFVKLTYPTAAIVALLALYTIQTIVQTLGMTAQTAGEKTQTLVWFCVSGILCLTQLSVIFVTERKKIINLPKTIKSRLASRGRAS